MAVNRAELLETCKTCNGSGSTSSIGTPPITGTITFPGVLNIGCSDCQGKGERLTPKGKEARDIIQGKGESLTPEEKETRDIIEGYV